MKKYKTCIAGFGIIIVIWVLLSLFFAWISGDVKGNFLNVTAWLFALFFAPVFIAPIIYFVLNPENIYGFTLGFYYGGLAITAFANKTFMPIESVDQVVVCFIISFVICYVANKIIELERKVAELTKYKETAELYMNFFKQKADDCGMGMYDYLEALKEFERENGRMREDVTGK